MTQHNFLDEARIMIRSGDGGSGMVSFRREKYVPRGGPDGGDGGHGGDIVFIARSRINTLRAFGRKVHFRAENGQHGGKSNRTGATGNDLEIEVPVGTIIRDDKHQMIADLNHPDQRIVVAKGGRGGRGNTRFKSSTNQAPTIAEKGEPGIEMWLNLELKLMADVGLVGMPNVGKSTLLSVISSAKPEIADYPFTTLVPNLGVVTLDYRDVVVADIPGLVEGAHTGYGLGHAFLRHVQRTRVIVHLLDATSQNPLADFHQINTELSLFDDTLAERPTLIVLNKMDMPEANATWEKLLPELEKLGHTPVQISAVTRQGVQELINKIFVLIDSLPPTEYTEEASEIPVYTPEEDENAFEIDRTPDGSFQITGKRIERVAQMTYWEFDDSLLRFQKILEAMGISKALEDAGVKTGDTVFIGDVELEWGD